MRFDTSAPGILSWEHPSPQFMRRAGHAVVVDDGVWLIDPPALDELDARLEELGAPVAGVLQLLDRHPRDCAALAAKYGVPLLVTPFDGGVEGMEMFPVVRLPVWKEVGVWIPSLKALIVPESLSGAQDFIAPGEGVGVHPMRRLLPPTGVRTFSTEHLLMGHGAAVHGKAAVSKALANAFAGSRRRIPQLVVAQVTRAATGHFR